ncbi:nitronate monooxygenase [Arcobacter aquimarinus]|uniref:Nitronate monooxygenase n=1 Tax=Arcobacter aquimarinus TaxID=1315211 RepID=A0AAE7E2D5_9BACT|nr:nitronate monooxygenase [Arcobacter aquimarinus]QKE26516.1 nitronate monooxygenase [Arcobacter aquimarinus]RXI34114.1 2-nitropropane dioxygenase [Arcobacter aquimarinus]
MKIGKYEIKHPIIQGGMGVGISWDQLAGNVSLEGGLGVISAVGTGYYKNKSENVNIITKKDKPKDVLNFYSKDALTEIFQNARKICADAPLACNVLYAINDYGRVVRDACQAGANIIITGAGIPTNMPEFTKEYPDVALIPIVSSARALKLICKKWERYNKLPDAVIVEGPLSGGHQGFKYEDCYKEEFQLENIVPDVIEEAKKWGNIPVIAAGGIWDKKDIDKFINMGCVGVQMATRFIGTFECDADAKFKNVLLNAKAEDIQLMKSPVGLPARGVRTNLQFSIENHTAPKVQCISNCVAPCNRGHEAKLVGYCIADRLGAAYQGDVETGLFFSGSNGYRIDKIISVKELIQKLTVGE